MNFLNTNQTPEKKLESLQKESSNILNIFEETASSLLEVNDKMGLERKKTSEKIEELKVIESKYDIYMSKNERVANKIFDFLNN